MLMTPFLVVEPTPEADTINALLEVANTTEEVTIWLKDDSDPFPLVVGEVRMEYGSKGEFVFSATVPKGRVLGALRRANSAGELGRITVSTD